MGRIRGVGLSLLFLLLAACGEGTEAGTGEDPESPQALLSESSVESFSDVKSSVVRIVATGSYVEAGVGELVGSWTGTGFFIDSDGLAVTNNHVATGAAFMEVYVDGEDEPRAASVVGLDECSDLAVIKVKRDSDEPGFAPLSFLTSEFDVGLTVYSAGFPLGDPEYTLTRGIVSKRDADGDTSWTSVEAVVQHDARINGGNSGGPLVSESGEVVGINFSRIDATDQNFAITAVDARPLIDRMIAGGPADSLGINAQAFVLESGVGGIFVQSVETGSAADEAGLLPGDFVTQIEGVTASVDGTMKDYCRVLRSKGATSELKLTAYRPSTGETLEGNVNGDGLVVIGQTDVAVGAGANTTGGGNGAGPSADVNGSVVVDVDGSQIRIPEAMAGWEIGTIDVGGQTLLVSVADDDNKRATGFQGAPSAFDLSGILFRYPNPQRLEFWTFGAAMRLDLAFFAADGSLIEVYRDLPICRGIQDDCARYPGQNSQYALSAPAGYLDFVNADTVLSFG